MSVQDPEIRPAAEPAELDLELLDDDVEGHGAKELIAGLSTAVVLGGATAGVAAAASSSGLDPRQTAHRAVDTAFDTADALADQADATLDEAAKTADRTISWGSQTAQDAATTAVNIARDGIETVGAHVDEALATVDGVQRAVREEARKIIQNDGDVDTSTRIASTMPRSFAGQAVTLTATVLAEEARVHGVTGSVTFLDGTRSLGRAAVGPGGVAKLTTDALAAGAHSIVAVYAGDSTYNGSMSSAATQDVVKALTATAVRSTVARGVVGSGVQLIANVASTHPGVIMPTGSVTFYEGDTRLGVGRIGPDGTASISTAALDVGVHQIVAQYAGDARHAGSESLPLPQAVVENPAVTAAELVATASSYVPDSVTLELRLGDTSAGASTADGTTVYFRSGDTIHGSATIKGGRATVTISGSASLLGQTIEVGYQGSQAPLASVQWLG